MSKKQKPLTSILSQRASCSKGLWFTDIIPLQFIEVKSLGQLPSSFAKFIASFNKQVRTVPRKQLRKEESPKR